MRARMYVRLAYVRMAMDSSICVYTLMGRSGWLVLGGM